MSRPTGHDGEVLAAGGVIVRTCPDGIEVAVVHRPHRHDWSFPKGHIEANEGPEQAAVREVEEETGFICRLVHPLGTIGYTDQRDRPKLVTYWAMAVRAGAFTANVEVDRLEWLAPASAARRLSYASDRTVLDRLVVLVGDGGLSAEPRSVP